MSISRILGLSLLAIATFTLGYDILKAVADPGGFSLSSLGGLWGKVNGASLNLVQAIVQRYLHPVLWDPILVNILLLPAFLVLGVPGLLVFLLGRKRQPDVA